MDKIIPLRIGKALIQKIDQMIGQGIFRNRNEGIREGIRLLIKNYTNQLFSKQIIAKIIANYLIFTHSEFIKAIILFGSVAYGNDKEESDIDLLVLTEKELSYHQKFEVTNEIVLLIRRLEYIISLHFQNIDTFMQGVKDNFSFETNIYKNGKFLAGTIPNLLNL